MACTLLVHMKQGETVSDLQLHLDLEFLHDSPLSHSTSFFLQASDRLRPVTLCGFRS